MVISEGGWGLLQGWQHRKRERVDLANIPDLKGKVALVTGSNSGIGKVTAQVLASKGAKVFMACRSKERAEQAMSEVRGETPDADLEYLAYDASSVANVVKAGQEFLRRSPRLDILMCNAGTVVGAPTFSADRLEWMFAVNHLAHFALVLSVLPGLEAASRATGDVRIVSTSSSGFIMHPDRSDLHLSDAELRQGGEQLWWPEAMQLYGRSKTSQVLFAAELSRRLRRPGELDWGQAVRSNALHPGTVGSTNLNSAIRQRWFYWIAESLLFSLCKIPTSAGSVNLLYAGTSPEISEQEITGEYLTPYGHVNRAAVRGTAAGDAQLGAELWRRSVQLVREQCDVAGVEWDVPTALLDYGGGPV